MHARATLAATALALSACAPATTPAPDTRPTSDITDTATPDGVAPDATVPEPTTTAAGLLGDLCAAADATDPPAAERAFLLAHEELHAIARELQESGDRPIAGRLLEAKQRVEAGFSSTPLPDDMDVRLDELASVAGEALATAGATTTTCDGKTS